MRERLGVRAASALAAATAVAMVLVVAGVSLVLVLESQLKRNTEEALLANAHVDFDVDRFRSIDAMVDFLDAAGVLATSAS